MRYPTIAAVLAVVLSLPGQALAEPASGPEGPAAPPVAEADAAAGEDAVAAAKDSGDLSRAVELATEARTADPSPENWHREGQIREELGDYDGAAKAYGGELAALPEDDPGRKGVLADLQRVRDEARGRVETEPASTHRGELDKQWTSSTKKGKKPAKRAEPAGKSTEDRIVRKWYFWVTVAAIVASAAAVTGIAIKAARDEKRDALDLQRRPTLGIPPMFRF
jgi:hypothetical protein